MRVFALAMLLAAAAGGAAAQDDRSDFVVFVQTPDGEPVAGATVVVGGRGASADGEGRATIPGLAPGRYCVRVSFVGRAPRELAARLDAPGPWALAVELAEDETQLGDVVVTARDLSRSRLAADGFFDREKLGGGTILTRQDIERRNPIRLGDALGTVTGVRVRTNSVNEDNFAEATPGRTATSVRLGEPCAMDVFLDGVYSTFLTADIDAIAAADVMAIEVYRGPSQVPTAYSQLGQGSNCGVVLVWTSASVFEGE